MLENRYIKETAAAFADILTIKTFAWSNPEMFQLYEIYNETKNENYELVIAVGGGSVLDVANRCAACMQNRWIRWKPCAP